MKKFDDSEAARAARRYLGYESKDITENLAINVKDEKGNYVLDTLSVFKGASSSGSPFAFMLSEMASLKPKVNLDGPKGPPSWHLSDMYPPGFPFWDIPTTLVVTDPRVQDKVRKLYVENFKGACRKYASQFGLIADQIYDLFAETDEKVLAFMKLIGVDNVRYS